MAVLAKGLAWFLGLGIAAGLVVELLAACDVYARRRELRRWLAQRRSGM